MVDYENQHVGHSPSLNKNKWHLLFVALTLLTWKSKCHEENFGGKMDLNDKVALIPGGVRGIPLALAERLLNAGAKVSICDPNEYDNRTTINYLRDKHGENNLIFEKCLFTEEDQLKKFYEKTIERFGKLDLVVNSVGIVDERPSCKKGIVEVNQLAVFSSTFLGLDYMSRLGGKEGGVIVNIGSSLGLKPCPLLPVYSATKAAINQFTRSLGDELHFRKTGVRIISINPGPTECDYIMYGGECLMREHYIKEAWPEFVQKNPLESVFHVAKSIELILRTADTGTVWTIEKEGLAELI